MTERVNPFSCDTMVALPSVTTNGQMIFGKNSDRPQEEAQPLVLRPRQSHDSGDSAGAQFVNVPQVKETFRHIGSKPYWCAGYEHGFNEHQVVIGNEALPTKLPVAHEPKLIGMEILRLGLERSSTAAEAVDVITGLVSEFGQGKFENSEGVRTYDNSYIIADPLEAYVVEAVGHDWAVRRAEGSTSISNVCSLGGPSDRVSPKAKKRATELGLFEMGFGEPFSFSKTFSDPEAAKSGVIRQCRTETLLSQHEGQIDPQTVMKVLSDHSDGEDSSEPFVENVNDQLSVCLHRTEGDAGGVSAASLVADLCATGERLPVYWCGMYSPCMTMFLPTFIEGDLPPALSIGDATPSDDSPWWMFYRLTHSAVKDGVEREHEIKAAWKPLQVELMESAYHMATRGRELIANGRPDGARDLLSGYMHENFVRMMEIGVSLERQAALK